MSKEMTEKSEKDGQGLKETNLKEKRKRVSRLGTSDVGESGHPKTPWTARYSRIPHKSCKVGRLMTYCTRDNE